MSDSMAFSENNRKLGFGLMRLPLKDRTDDSCVDIEAVKGMVDEFMGNGFTYFDTALMYHGGKSQNIAKEVLIDRYPRNSYTLATKLHFDYFNSGEEMDKILRDQLSFCGVSYFDYYLLHDVEDGAIIDKYEKYDCFGWMLRQKKKGLMHHIGFSYHDKAALLDRILTDHPEVEFVQLQINYFDWESPIVESRKCYEVCVKHNKPVIVMEPVRGGTLTGIPKEARKLFTDYSPDMSMASWAVRFAASLDNVKMVLSGMSSMEQVRDNTSYMKDFKPFNDTERKLVDKVSHMVKDMLAVPCTGCSYCTAGCPMKIMIPKYFLLYNLDEMEKESVDHRAHKGQYRAYLKDFGAAGQCIGCGQCEAMCPQHIDIIEKLKLVADRYE